MIKGKKTKYIFIKRYNLKKQKFGRVWGKMGGLGQKWEGLIQKNHKFLEKSQNFTQFLPIFHSIFNQYESNWVFFR